MLKNIKCRSVIISMMFCLFALPCFVLGAEKIIKEQIHRGGIVQIVLEPIENKLAVWGKMRALTRQDQKLIDERKLVINVQKGKNITDVERLVLLDLGYKKLFDLDAYAKELKLGDRESDPKYCKTSEKIMLEEKDKEKHKFGKSSGGQGGFGDKVASYGLPVLILGGLLSGGGLGLGGGDDGENGSNQYNSGSLVDLSGGALENQVDSGSYTSGDGGTSSTGKDLNGDGFDDETGAPIGETITHQDTLPENYDSVDDRLSLFKQELSDFRESIGL